MTTDDVITLKKSELDMVRKEYSYHTAKLQETKARLYDLHQRIVELKSEINSEAARQHQKDEEKRALEKSQTA